MRALGECGRSPNRRTQTRVAARRPLFFARSFNTYAQLLRPSNCRCSYVFWFSILMTTFPRACPSSRYRIASGTLLKL